MFFWFTNFSQCPEIPNEIGVIEIGVSYDDEFEQSILPKTPEEKINELFKDIIQFLGSDNYDLPINFETFPLKKARVFPTSGGHDDVLKRVNQIWVNNTSCDYLDVYIHITGRIDAGGTSSSAICQSVFDTGLPRGAIVKIVTPGGGSPQFAHELFHNLLTQGSHETDPKNILYFGGPNSINPDYWKMTTDQICQLKYNVAYSCFHKDEDNVTDDRDCFNYDNNLVAEPGPNIIHNNISHACGDPNEFDLNASIFNNCLF